MNIVLYAVTIGSIAFLLRFLMALMREQKRTPRILKAHLLHRAIVVSEEQVPARPGLRVVGPREFNAPDRLSISGTKITQQQKLG